MFDLADTVPLTFLVTDASGNPVNTGATPVCTITLPDASTATPAVIVGVTGTYTASYLTTQAGRHFVRWVGTGTNASAFTDVFDVHSATGGPQLFSLDEARKALREPSAQTADNEEIRGYVVAATHVVEDVYGPVIPATRTQTFDGGARCLFADSTITSVVSVVESGSAKTVGVDYTVDYDAGILTRGVFYEPGSYTSIWAPGIQNVVVTYKVGVAPGSVIPEHVRKAGRIIMRSLWQADQQAYRPAFGQPDAELVTTPSGMPIPKAAYELLKRSSTEIGFS